jgi:hypothetical protein
MAELMRRMCMSDERLCAVSHLRSGFVQFTLPELTCADVNIDVEDVNVKNNQVEKSITKKPFLADYKKEADKSGKWDGGVTEENAPVIPLSL